jgi:hypothetical protein
MQRAKAFILILFLLASGLNLFAQEEDSQDTKEDDWTGIISAPFSRGDKNLVISLGLVIPVYFSGIEDNEHGISIGGTGSLAFNYFLTSGFFVGGELGAMFASTRRGNMLYIIPFGVRAGYQFWFGRFELPISLMIGFAPQKYLEKGYIGPFVKPSVSLFWRFNSDWSFGLNSEWWFIPQWPSTGEDVIGNFLELTLSAKYHF